MSKNFIDQMPDHLKMRDDFSRRIEELVYIIYLLLLLLFIVGWCAALKLIYLLPYCLFTKLVDSFSLVSTLHNHWVHMCLAESIPCIGCITGCVVSMNTFHLSFAMNNNKKKTKKKIISHIRTHDGRSWLIKAVAKSNDVVWARYSMAIFIIY